MKEERETRQKTKREKLPKVDREKEMQRKRELRAVSLSSIAARAGLLSN